MNALATWPATPNRKARSIFRAVISCLLLAPALAWGDVTYTNITVPAQAEISGAGNAGLPDGSGVAPIMETLPPGATVLTVMSVTGLISLNSQDGFNDPDGTVVQGGYGLSIPNASYMNPYGGISGITGPGAGFLVGVFTNGAPPTGTAPPSLDFVSTDQGGINPNFTSLSPQLYQVFFIGDGLTGDGSGTQQQFIVPAGATTLYLGISDAPGFDGGPGAYGDNSGNFTVTAVATAPVPVITSPAAASGTALAAFSYQITATNQPTSFGALGLPAGLTLDSTTGLISGTLGPAAGADQVTLSATNAAGTGMATLTLTVAPVPGNPPVINSPATAKGRVGQAFTYQITAANQPTSFGALGLPAGLTLDPSAGLISGTLGSVAGVSQVTLSATNAAGAGTAVLTLAVSVAPLSPPVISSPATASGTALAAFSYQITATNQPASFGAAGLPAGLTVDPNSGLISGTLGSAAGASQVTLNATNSAGTGTAVLTLTVAAAPVNPPVITSPASANGQVGQAFTYQIAASNTPTSYIAAGLPPGLSADATTGLISGTPSQAGTFSVTLSAANSGGAGMASLNLIIAASQPVVSLAATTPKVTLGSGKAGVFTITLSAAQTTHLTVAYTIKGTAINGVDYKLLTGKETFKAGETSLSIRIVPEGDLEGASKKTVKIALAPGADYTVASAAPLKVRILAP